MANWRIDVANSGFATPIDALQLELVQLNGAALIFDNLVFEPVPEPTTYALWGLAIASLAWLRFCQGRNKNPHHSVRVQEQQAR